MNPVALCSAEPAPTKERTGSENVSDVVPTTGVWKSVNANVSEKATN
jgi:hypothetical protein